MENKTILFNIASRSRPTKFHKLIRNVVDMCDNIEDIIFLCKLDEDDPKLSEYESDWQYTYELNRFIPCVGKSDNKIHAINRDIPKDGWDILVDVSDDFVFTKKGFDNIIRQHCGPGDCLHFPEPFATKQNAKNLNNNIIIMACMGREYYNRFGYIFNPTYKSLFCDNELTDVAKLTGAYKFVNENIFYHAHPAAGYGVKDKQTVHTESFWKEDEKTYKQRKAINFGL